MGESCLIFQIYVIQRMRRNGLDLDRQLLHRATQFANTTNIRFFFHFALSFFFRLNLRAMNWLSTLPSVCVQSKHVRKVFTVVVVHGLDRVLDFTFVYEMHRSMHAVHPDSHVVCV